MNMYAVLESDEDEDFTMVQSSSKSTNKTNKTGGNKSNQSKTKPTGNSSPAPETTVPVSEKPQSGRGGGRGHNRSGRGGRGGKHTEKGDAPPRKREYERRSGTGRGKEIAKGGAGKANWGNPKVEAEEAAKEEIVETTGSNDDVVEAVGWVADAEPEVEKEPEVPTYTLDEYLATRNNARANSEIFGDVSVRKVDADFSGMKTKQEEEDTFIALGGGSKKDHRNKKDQRSGKNAKILDVGFSCAPTEQVRNDRDGGRGRGRGRNSERGGRGEGRGGRGRGGRRAPEARVDINDASAFPSL